ncbi:DUF1640 domain-containing protein [Extensimonas vulgaris]|jgi:hypothetical protein|uniref:DUF1640 domain-containing protein n=1 Tax=Extensimonas vulgaris TaxID=1031594 RepID=A0A369ARW0_9BURK|nr:DUF1640 domain-containing protein [Extensimonas vulgaris]RCX11078.1 hypothetical protein DFR45_102481 [Extensimonas vulgaris]TWI41751.1 hypothetical protein IP95_00511 [Extensimonas vulgaris]TXD16214.1 DUF1640 domain-containing protein [Extensimonas vulgaris]
MSAITFDTLKYANRLKAAGMDPRLAEEQAEALADALTEQTQLTTKTDLVELRMATKADLADAKTDLIKWVAGMLVAQAAVVATLVKLL